ncbi:MAG TPA: PadR family transcriptional regulator [Bacteroidia bacterium]|jgi:PadR family transcriptional regulator PadR|nr:PadR family transcriptional regulator [Bacteroidia bacterium]
MSEETDFIQRWNSQVKKGILEFIILLMLSKRNRYGYELIVEIKKYTEYDVAEGTIYPLLNRLKTCGMVDSNWEEMESGMPRKYYKITSVGKKNLSEMKKQWLYLISNIQSIK